MKTTGRTLKRLAFIGVILFGAIIIVWSLFAAASSTGISVGMAAPAAAGVVLIVWAVYHLKCDKPVLKPKWLRVAFIICVCAGIALILVLEMLMMTAASAEPEDDAGVVIVLGSGIFPDGRLSLSLRSRLDAAYDYLTAHPDVKCIVAGGQGDNEPISEAQAMQRDLISRGIDVNRIYVEAESTSTEENLTYALDIMEQNNLSGKAAVVTSDYHIFRALLLAERLGLDAFGIPSPTSWRVWLSDQVRECLAIVKTVVFPEWKIE